MTLRQAVVLAGGLGTRLGELTKTVPKPMVPIDGVPFLELLVRRLKKQGFDDIVMLVGHLGEQISSHFGDGSRFKVDVSYSVERELLGTGGALKQAEGLLAESFMVLYGDSYLPIDYAIPMSMFEGSGKSGLLTVYSNSPRIARNNVALDIDRGGRKGAPGPFRVLDYKKGGELPAMNGVEAGVFFLRRDCLSAAPSGRFSLEEEVFPKLIKRRELLGWMTDVCFLDIGTPGGLEEARRTLNDAD